jgi:hypothetical protein
MGAGQWDAENTALLRGGQVARDHALLNQRSFLFFISAIFNIFSFFLLIRLFYVYFINIFTILYLIYKFLLIKYLNLR